MTGNAVQTIYKTLSLSWLTGPIFDKELRVSSRRRRNYVLRIAYLAILLLLVVFIWANMVDRRSGNAIYQASRLSEAGLMITSFVVGFQFYAAQIIAAIMLSNSISDEIYNKTLGALMSTPITSVQIIGGKLFSKLLQIGMLLCFTLPILGIVRVFGGVPWDFLISSFCLTVTAVLFAAMLSINISIQQKHAYSVIITTIITLAGLYILIPLFAAWIIDELNLMNQTMTIYWISITDPLMMMQVMLTKLFNQWGGGLPNVAWWWNCLVMLTGSLLLFVRAVVVVRKKALMQACGQLAVAGKKKKNGKVVKTSSKIRRIRGNPMLWKELRIPITKAGRIKKNLLFLLVGGALGFGYFICAKEGEFRANRGDIHIFFAILYMLIGVFFSTILAATTITSERHSQNWPLLLGTLITDWNIIGAKLAGVLRRSLPFWAFLFGHIIIFILIGQIHPSALLHSLMIVVPMIFLVSSSGLFFSTLFKRTTSAVIANMIYAAFIWGIVIFLAILIGEFAHAGDDLVKLTLTWNPFYHIGQIMDDAAGPKNAAKALSQLRYRWEFGDKTGFWGTVFMLAGINMINVTVGFVFLAIAKANFRKRIFK